MSASKTSKDRIISNMNIAKQLAVFVANKPGTLASVCETLAANNINIHAVSTSDTTDHSVIRLILDDPNKALRIFEKQGTLVVVTEVLMIDTDSQVGNLATIARFLADHKVNVEYAYCAASPQAMKGLMIMRIYPLAKAMKLLNTYKA